MHLRAHFPHLAGTEAPPSFGRHLEDQLAIAADDAAEACDREDTYSMMEERLHALIADDQSRINAIQQVIESFIHEAS